ncbi:hypothetical protein FD754_006517 [Muntiacus muntjak]|uniref:RRM domain-containing protein n=1 Tax=Muntiacus muntjak TaxID=9888 RepID=A0A5N3WKU3_MUNMU|nr:hypothetical protein FD754_006517 [Muntiacus muntjak]
MEDGEPAHKHRFYEGAHGSGKSARRTPAGSHSKEDARHFRSKARSRSESTHYTSSRSQSRSHSRFHSRSYSRDYRRWCHVGNRANLDPNYCFGVFGLSLYTTERDLRAVFCKYGPQSRHSRGFSFVYLENVNNAKEAKGHARGGGWRAAQDRDQIQRRWSPPPSYSQKYVLHVLFYSLKF